ncbi:MAG: aldo/keto reductase [Alistipes sp.]|jgi:predicted aldo/keto reductase-like oxidoreductase|nr:aldo/keto reductase [Alistipes sp.]
MKKTNKDITRRDFLKVAGAGAVVSVAALAGCRPAGTISAQGGEAGDIPTDQMTYRTNPHSGDRVSLLGYGCMRWPLRRNEAGEQEIDQETVNDLVDYALAHGVNYFDTAPVYVRGWSEAATGNALSRHPRDSYFVATKASNPRGPFDLEGCKAMYRQSMDFLKVDYLDYYLLHNVGSSIESFHERFVENGFLDFLIAEKAAGRIRNLGWSFHGNPEVFDYVLAFRDIQWDFCQIQLNYQDWQYPIGASVAAKYLYDELVKKNVPVVIMEPLLGGRLARVPAGAQALMRGLHPQDTPAKWAFRYAGTPESVLTVLSGMVYMEHLQENLRTFAPMEPMNEAEYAILDDVSDILANADYIQCTTCEYCMPCPYGLDIPQVFAHYNKCVGEGQVLHSSGDEGYRAARRAFLVGYDRSVPKLRQANRCIQCEQCLPKCPQGIKIPTEMERVDAYAEKLRQKLQF